MAETTIKAVLPNYAVRRDLVAARLVHILPDWQLPSGGIYAVYSASRFRPANVTAFVEVLRQALHGA